MPTYKNGLSGGVLKPQSPNYLVYLASVLPEPPAQLVQRIGLVDELLMAQELELSLGLGGQVAAQDEDLQVRPAIGQGPHHLEPRGPGHVEIEEDGVDAAGRIPDQVDRLQAVGGAGHPVALADEGQLEEVPQRPLVVHHEQRLGAAREMAGARR